MRLMLVVILFAGCGSSGGSGGGASCETRANELAAWATTVVDTYGGELMASDKLVEDRDASPLPPRFQPGSVIMVTHDAISVDGAPATGADAIAARLAEAHHDGPVVLFLDRDAPIALVATVATALGARDVELGVARPVTPLPPPPRSSVTDELAAGDPSPSEHAAAIAHVMRRVIDGCPAFATAMTTRASDGSASKAQMLLDAIRPSLIECSCNLDVDALRSTFWALLGPGTNPPAGLVHVTLAAADDHAAASVTGATWADAAPALFAAAAAGKHVRIVAR